MSTESNRQRIAFRILSAPTLYVSTSGESWRAEPDARSLEILRLFARGNVRCAFPFAFGAQGPVALRARAISLA